MDEEKRDLGEESTVPAEEPKDKNVEKEEEKSAGGELGSGSQGGDCEAKSEPVPDPEPEVASEGDDGESAKEEVELLTFLPKGSACYVKKPVQVRAVKLFKPFRVKTLEGELQGQSGDYLIEGIEGELYPCKPGIFDQTYTRM